MFIKKDTNLHYNRFDAGAGAYDCNSCDPLYCSYAPFASYDASGVLMEMVPVASSVAYTYSGYAYDVQGAYKQADSDPIKASVEPYYHSAAPCCYSLDVSSVYNHSIEDSWCQSCDRLNKIYTSRIDTMFTGGPENDPGTPSYVVGSHNYVYHNQNYVHTFWLCDNSDKDLEVIAEDGTAIAKSHYSPCANTQAAFYVNVEKNSADEPEIIAYLWINGYVIQRTNDRWGEQVAHYGGIRQGWRKVIAPYDGDYDEYIDSRDDRDAARERGTYDGRNFQATFYPEDKITDLVAYSGYSIPGSYYDYTNPFAGNQNHLPIYPGVGVAPGVCNYNSAVLTVTPSDTHEEYWGCNRNEEQHLNMCNPQVISSGWHDYSYTNPFSETWTYGTSNPVSNTAIITIGGITGIDDDDDSELVELPKCDKCGNLNREFVLQNTPQPFDYGVNGSSPYLAYAGNILYEWNAIEQYQTSPSSFGTYSFKDDLMLDMCCQCAGSSVCIDQLRLELVTTSGDPTLEHTRSYAKLSLMDKAHGEVAAYQTAIGYGTTAEPFRVDCNNLNFDLTYTSGTPPDENSWQRCNFEEASVSVQLGSTDSLYSNCSNEPYRCWACADGYAPTFAIELQGFEHFGLHCHVYAGNYNEYFYRQYECQDINAPFILQEGIYNTSYSRDPCSFQYSFESLGSTSCTGGNQTTLYAGGVGCPTRIFFYIEPMDWTNDIAHKDKVKLSVAVMWGSFNGILWERMLPSAGGQSIIQIPNVDGAGQTIPGTSVALPYLDCAALDGMEIPFVSYSPGYYSSWETQNELVIFGSNAPVGPEWDFDESSVILHVL